MTQQGHPASNKADDSPDLIVDWNHRHRSSVAYGGEEAHGSGVADTSPLAQAQSRNSERESLFDRIGALASRSSAAAAMEQQQPSSQRRHHPPESSASSQPPATAADVLGAPRTVHFYPKSRLLVVEGRHHYTPHEISATWYNGAEATALHQTCITDVQAMRRRIRRGIDLHHHTHALHGGDYSERGLEHMISAAVYQEVAAEQYGAIQAVLAAQGNTRRGSSGLPSMSSGEMSDQGSDQGNNSSVSGDDGRDHLLLAQISADRSRRARERAERLGRADAEEAVLLDFD